MASIEIGPDAIRRPQLVCVGTVTSNGVKRVLYIDRADLPLLAPDAARRPMPDVTSPSWPTFRATQSEAGGQQTTNGKEINSRRVDNIALDCLVKSNLICNYAVFIAARRIDSF